VGTSQDWQDIVGLIQRAPDRHRSPHVARFYALAIDDGMRTLRSFRERLGEDRLRDLIHDLLASALDAILDAESPRAFFTTSLRRRAIDWIRRPDAAIADHDDPRRENDVRADRVTAGAAIGNTTDADHGFVMDARAALAQLSERDRDIVLGVAYGEDRERLAQEHRTTRQNIDQIVSRARRVLHDKSAEKSR